MAAARRDGVVMRDLGPGGPVRHVTAAVRRGGESAPAVSRVLEALREAGRAHERSSRRTAADVRRLLRES
jgi:hypothetical protein